MLSALEVREIADVANKSINFPFLKEGGEKLLLCGGIVMLDEAISEYLGINLNQLFENLSEGISKEEKEKLVSELTSFINSRVNVKFLSEGVEGILINEFLNYIIDLGAAKLKERIA